MSGYRFLIVDDSKFTRQLLKGILHQLGHEVISETNNYEEALFSFKNYSPDITVISLSGMNEEGLQLLDQIKKTDTEATVIVCCSAVQQDLLVTAVKMGASGYLLKPFSQEDVQECVLRHGAAGPPGLPEAGAEERAGLSEEPGELHEEPEENEKPDVREEATVPLAEEPLVAETMQEESSLIESDVFLPEAAGLTLYLADQQDHGYFDSSWPEPQILRKLEDLPLEAPSETDDSPVPGPSVPRRLADVVQLNGAMRFTANSGNGGAAAILVLDRTDMAGEDGPRDEARDEEARDEAREDTGAFAEGEAVTGMTNIEHDGESGPEEDIQDGDSSVSSLMELAGAEPASFKDENEELGENQDDNKSKDQKEDKDMINKQEEQAIKEQVLKTVNEESQTMPVRTGSLKAADKPTSTLYSTDGTRQTMNYESPAMNHFIEQFQQIVSWLPVAMQAVESAVSQETVMPVLPSTPEPATEKKVTRTHMCNWSEDIDGENKEYRVVCTEGENKLNIEMSCLNQKNSLTFSLDSFFDLVGWLEEMVGRPAAEKS